MQLDGPSALDLLARVIVGGVREVGPDLTTRQLALMLMVHRMPGPHTVKRLAIDLNISKPAITRALDTLSQLEFIRRQRDEKDRRNVRVMVTEAGMRYLNGFENRVRIAVHGLAA